MIEQRKSLRSLWRIKSSVKPGLFVARDLKSLIGVWRVEQWCIDGKMPEQIEQLANQAMKFLNQLPDLPNPLVLQWYYLNEPIQRLEPSESTVGDSFQQEVEDFQQQHQDQMAQSSWLDTAVTGCEFSLKRRQVYCVLSSQCQTSTDTSQAMAAIDYVHEQLSILGLEPHPLTQQEFLQWWSRWLVGSESNEQIPSTQGLTIDLVEKIFQGKSVRTCPKSQSWRVSKHWHRFIRTPQATVVPNLGMFSAQMEISGHQKVLWDTLDNNYMLVVSIVAESSSTIQEDISHSMQVIKGQHPLAIARRKICAEVLAQAQSGHRILSVSTGIYLKALSSSQIRKASRKLLQVMGTSQLPALDFEQDVFQADHWLSHLPGNFSHHLDHRWYRKITRLWHSQHAVNLLPIFGSHRSTIKELRQQQTLRFFNRSGEQICFDPLSAQGRIRNAHSIILGTTGVGKTALVVHLLTQLYAKHKPRIFVISTLPTFEPLMDYMASHQQSVFRLQLRSGSPSSLSLFSQAGKAAKQVDNPKHLKQGARDLMGEIEVMVDLLMKGQGVAAMQPWERSLVTQAILSAGRIYGDDVVVSHVVEELKKMSSDEKLRANQRDKTVELAAALERYTWGLAGDLFNQPGTAWPKVDCTLLDLGISARKGYEHLRSLAYVSFLSHIHAQVEHEKHRETIVVTDEAHVVISQESLGGYIASLTAQWRTYGAWKWLVTQNMQQFGQASKAFLSLVEWWWILGGTPDDIESLKKFAQINTAEAQLISSCAKLKHRYVEGVLLSAKHRGRFRAIPPALDLALALTDPDEKSQIALLREEKGLSELEARLTLLSIKKSSI